MKKEIEDRSIIARKRYHSDPEYKKRKQLANKKWRLLHLDYWRKHYLIKPLPQKLACAKWMANNTNKLKANYLELKKQSEDSKSKSELK